jgi:hypothetical protein
MITLVVKKVTTCVDVVLKNAVLLFSFGQHFQIPAQGFLNRIGRYK